jgi:CRP-like cAMP-binding protein
MPKDRPPAPPPGNRLLARLPVQEVRRLLPGLRAVPLEFGHVLYQPRSPIDHAYFPVEGVVSQVAVMEDGASIELATIGNEGMIGLPICFGVNSPAARSVVQVGGRALRMRAAALKEETSREGPLRRLLLRYGAAFLTQVSQSVACNGLHTVPRRCCRWLLMTHDRMQSDEFPLTHEFLAQMLGVQRSSLSEVLRPLQEAGLLRYRRGRVAIRDRAGLEAASCECYRAVKEEYDRLLG